MKSITVDGILELGPCLGYTKEYLEEIFDGREEMDLFDIACEIDIPEGDRLWLLIRMIPTKLQFIFACDCAERDLLLEREAGREPCNRLWEAIRMKRVWIDERATDEQLKIAINDTSAVYIADSTYAARAVYAAANASAADAAASACTAAAAAAYASAADAAASACTAAAAAAYAAAAHAAAIAAVAGTYAASAVSYADDVYISERNWQIDHLLRLVLKHDA